MSTNPHRPLRNPLTALLQRGAGYWFGSDFALSHAVLRIAVGVSLLLMLNSFWQPNWPAFFTTNPVEKYRPIGILKIFGKAPPGPSFWVWCQWLGYVSAWCVIVGFLTRLSFVVLTVCALCRITLIWCYQEGWSHGQNVLLLAGIAMMFGRTTPLSVDALVATWWRRGQAVPVHDGHRWPVLLTQFTVAWMFANAAFWKLYKPGEPFGIWATSDNLRNYLIQQYWVLHVPPPEWLEWVLLRPWAYKAMAFGNLFSQLAPLVACFLVRWPRLRALLGFTFVVEVYMIGKVMGLHNPYWYFLYAAFIDWDRLAAWLQRRWTAAPRAVPAAMIVPTPRKAVIAVGLCLYISFSVFVGLTHRGHKRYTYPFTSCPMFSTLLVDRPYDQHLPKTIQGSTWTIDAEPRLAESTYVQVVWINHYQTPEWPWPQLIPEVEGVARRLSITHKHKVQRIVLEKTAFEIPPVPENEVRPKQSAIACIWEPERVIGLEAKHGYDAERGQHYVEITPHGMTAPTFTIGYHHRYIEPWQPLAVELLGNRYYFTKSGNEHYYVVVRVADPGTIADGKAFAAGVVR